MGIMKSLFMSDCSEGDYGKEALLDYEMSWVLRLCAEKNVPNDKLKKNCLAIMSELLDIEPALKPGDVTQVKVWKQWQRIDLIAEITINGVLHVLALEDKAYTFMKEDQRESYPKTVREWYAGKGIPKDNFHFVVITMFESEQEEFKQLEQFVKSSPWTVMPAWEFGCKATGNDLFDEFWINEWRVEE